MKNKIFKDNGTGSLYRIVIYSYGICWYKEISINAYRSKMNARLMSIPPDVFQMKLANKEYEMTEAKKRYNYYQ